ncbi:MotA/TolQ/ExbB proton channel family protein [Luteolibacter algae]|uniref:MotA/TolQ/ExbB proton channel family protein n=1 Tax=Luteolibacter algae TaxID=454151 RepID=A0ABW5D8B8_9BACT
MINAIQLTLREGGLTLYALLILAVTIYSILFSVWRHISCTRKVVAKEKWLMPSSVGNSLPWNRTMPSPREVQRSYASFELDEMAWVERRLPFLNVLISAAPLLGLLGTVAGMLITFSGMAAGNDAPIDTISTGISKALVTTQAGLVIAIPAAFLLALIKRQTETTHLELQRQLHTRLAEVREPATNSL